MERVNNALWCCDEIEELIKHYKKQYLEAKTSSHIQDKAKALVYYKVIMDLEIILYGESDMVLSDAVEVVRCKDCKKWNNTSHICGEFIANQKLQNGGRAVFITEPDDFCSYGIRKE